MARIDDGYQTTISFSLESAVQFWEKAVTPPGLEGGGEVDTTTMANSEYRTRNPKALITMSNMTSTSAYDPAVYSSILSMLNQNQQITVTFPDSSTLTFWGWIDSFVPGELVEGEQPTAEVTIIPSNQDDNGDEQAPVYAAGASS